MTNCDDYQVPIWDRPAVIHFDGLGHCFYDLVGYRTVKKGEYYVDVNTRRDTSAYRAVADSEVRLWVLRPSLHAIQMRQWKRGGVVNLEEME